MTYCTAVASIKQYSTVQQRRCYTRAFIASRKCAKILYKSMSQKCGTVQYLHSVQYHTLQYTVLIDQLLLLVSYDTVYHTGPDICCNKITWWRYNQHVNGAEIHQLNSHQGAKLVFLIKSNRFRSFTNFTELETRLSLYCTELQIRLSLFLYFTCYCYCTVLH